MPLARILGFSGAVMSDWLLNGGAVCIGEAPPDLEPVRLVGVKDACLVIPSGRFARKLGKERLNICQSGACA